jgi:hypothetical protein
MTVSTEFFNWSLSKIPAGKEPYNKTAPAIESLRKYLAQTWKGKWLGGYNLRKIKNTDYWSVHAYGAAGDWNYGLAHNGPGRRVARREIIPFLINNSKELGVQAIHDYYGSRIWRANRSGNTNGGWAEQPESSVTHMGQKWATYLHIEVNKNAWSDGRTVARKLKSNEFVDVQEEPRRARFDPANGHFGDYPSRRKQQLSRGASGDEVRYMQGVLRKARINVAVDGVFGPQTADRVSRFQQRYGVGGGRQITVDAETWNKIDEIARGK